MYHQSWLSSSRSNSETGTALLKPASCFLALGLVVLIGSASSQALASPARLTTPPDVARQSNVLYGSVSDRFSNVPAGLRQRKRPTDVKIYEYDQKPLAERRPFLLVHGLRGEYYPYFRWRKWPRN